MAQTESEERLNENRDTSTSENVISELPGKKFGITLEVPMFLLMFTMSLSGVAVNNILMYRTCVHSLHHEDTVCQDFLAPDQSNVPKHLEVEVQKYVTLVSTVKVVLESLVPAVLSFFLGVWSDTYGRKPLIVWSIFGMTMSSILIVVYGLFPNFGPWWFLLTVIPYSATGGFVVLFTGVMCYMSDITTRQNRSLRITIIEVMISLGSVLGGISSSYVLKAVGKEYLLLISASLNVVGYAYTNIYIRESLTGAIQASFSTVLDLLLVKEMMRECFKRRPNKGRAQILLLTIANALSIFILYGLYSLEYLYTREKLHWALKDYTIFSAVNTTISFIGSLFGVGVIQKILPINDLAFSIIAFISLIADYLVKAFATLGWHMYLGAGISAFKGLSAPLIRSYLTKILPVEDIAKVFALISAMEGIAPLFAPLIYNGLYEVTISTFPGAIYIMTVVICVCGTIMLGFAAHYARRPLDTNIESLN